MRAPFLTFVGVFCVAAACPARAGDGEMIGTGVGAAMGGLVGSQIGHGTEQIVSTGIGVAVGGAVGNTVGHAMDASGNTVAYGGGRPAFYSDPAPIAYGTYAPNYVAPPAPPPTYVDQQTQTYCRQYSQEINIAGHAEESYGTACLQPDGTWRIMP
jgi:surface antigen